MSKKTSTRTAVARADSQQQMGMPCRHYDKRYVKRACTVCGCKFGVCPICCPNDRTCGDTSCQVKLSPAEIVEELEGEITMYRESYAEVDGTVKDSGARRTIVALQAAAAIVKRHTEEALPR